MCDSTQKDKRHAHAALNASLFVTESLNYLYRAPLGISVKMKIFLFASSRFLGMTNKPPLCRGSQQLPQQLIDCGAWMIPSWMQGLVVSTDCSGRLQIGYTICS